MNRVVVGQASRLPPGRLAPGFVAGETPAKTAGTAAPLLPRPCSWSQCAQSMAWGLFPWTGARISSSAGISARGNPRPRRAGARRSVRTDPGAHLWPL